MGFKLKKRRKRKEEDPKDPPQETKKEKRVRKRKEKELSEAIKDYGADVKLRKPGETISPRGDGGVRTKFKLMIPVSEKLPPDTREQIITYHPEWGFDLGIGFIIRQHLKHDNYNLGFTRITHWYPTNKL